MSTRVKLGSRERDVFTEKTALYCDDFERFTVGALRKLHFSNGRHFASEANSFTHSLRDSRTNTHTARLERQTARCA